MSKKKSREGGWRKRENKKNNDSKQLKSNFPGVVLVSYSNNWA